MRRLPVVALLVAATLVIPSCARRPDTAKPAGVVERLLELRRDRSTNASDYAPLLAEPDLAATLASDSVGLARSGGSPTPDWEAPRVLDETPGTARVLVVWKDRKRYPAFPAATLFVLTSSGGRWVVSDAEATATVGK